MLIWNWMVELFSMLRGTTPPRPEKIQVRRVRPIEPIELIALY